MIKSLSLEGIKAIHAYQIKTYNGTAGIRDQNLLESALAQPLIEIQFTGASIYRMAACYWYHLNQNHPFIDGNKRTAFATMYAFLRINGIELLCDEEEAYTMVLDIIAHKKGKDDLEAWLEGVTRQL
ncbi:MAG TPA: type II toxin-antitoxin system death-on-curing family toxin [Ktedonobacteraceae bacterium]|nr:type II toxin-antitoxin system death-on-curing family toxin [Ktedonobacteraceae bacterium]